MIPKIFGPDVVPRSQDTENPTNKRKTTRYNFITFLPITLFIQFLKVINIFYAFNAVLQYIPAISTANPLATVIPLSFVVILGIIKELVVEIKRFYGDRHVNLSKYTKVSKVNEDSIQKEEILYQDIKVGDILELRDGEAVPCDCILLKTKDRSGQVYVQTAALDGERNLKPLLAPR